MFAQEYLFLPTNVMGNVNGLEIRFKLDFK